MLHVIKRSMFLIFVNRYEILVLVFVIGCIMLKRPQKTNFKIQNAFVLTFVEHVKSFIYTI